MAGIALFLTALVLAAAPAEAATKRLVYVKGSASVGTIYSAHADGSHQRKLKRGAYPALAPDGRWVAYVNADRDELRFVLPSGGEILQTTIDDRELFRPGFSPDAKKVGVTSSSRLYVNVVDTGETIRTPKGAVAGWSFSPDSKRVVYSRAKDLYVLDLSTKRSSRLTNGAGAVNPLWTARGIVYDQVSDAHFTLQRRNEVAGDVENLVDQGPAPDALTSGLVPVAASRDGNRILAAFEGQSRHDPYAVEDLAARSLAEGLTPTDLSRDGATVLASTGIGDPSDPSNVVTLPWGGGPPKVLVKNASWARWNR